MASWPRGDKRCTRHATGGSGDATGAQGDVIPDVCAVAAGPGGLERERRGHAESHVLDAGGLFALDDRGERPALATGNARWEVGSGFCALLTQAASVEARCIRKAPSEPLICGTTGGEVRRSCLSPRSGRVLRRPPVVSSAGESSAKPTTGEAGSPFLPTSLATQRSRAPAGRRRGFAKHRFAPPQPAGCANPAVESGTGDARPINGKPLVPISEQAQASRPPEH